jgi:hypothetical protein
LKPVKTFDLEKPSCLDDVDIIKMEWTQMKEEKSSGHLPDLVIATTKKIFVFKMSFSMKNENNIESEDCSISISELFCHDGHRSDVSQSISNQHFRNLFFSSDVTNNLHAWAFPEK